MKKLSLKWKLFLISNYFLLTLILFSILGGIFSLVGAKEEIKGFWAIILYLIIFILVALVCILNIYVINRYFPDTPLSEKIRKIVRNSRIVMILATVLLGLIFAAFISIIFDSTKLEDWWSIMGLIFFGILFLFCLYITILQYQIPRYLNKRSTGVISKLIDSIGS
jgi:hypothetical protein